ncbi:lanthionine synthetase C family protein [Actinomadura graeca]|uniref:Lanthionine synthetase C family protein n=1 Tax=Actinomadura graeca TaxID=2750812 RepID=A0ABX8QYF2_9ACTN|nr:lanthionine synthetase C family protein [Actinomadura graeca]QXJ22482.1 lanthionine synthetase C family protein [Actinomadura graeca]
MAEIAGDPRNKIPYYGHSTWNPVSLAHGHPGVALAAAQAAVQDDRWLPMAHAHITAALDAVRAYPATGLYCGPAAILAAVTAARRAGAPYRRLHAGLVPWVADDLLKRCEEEAGRRNRGPGVGWHGYDVVSGIGGLTRLLMAVADDPSGDPEVLDHARRAADAGLEQLAAVLRPVRVGGHEVPGWWVPSHLQPTADDERTYPLGDFNAGFAHGPAGPMAVLAAAALRGTAPAGAEEGVSYAAEWLAGRALRDEAGPYWPCRVSWREQLEGAPRGEVIARSAWCYGAPGLGLALDAAGRAFGRPEWSRLALDGLRAVFARPRDAWKLDGVTVCHGTSGLLAAAHRLAGPGSRELGAFAAGLAREIAGACDPALPFGYRHAVRAAESGTADDRRLLLDVAGVLDGAAGVAAVLLDTGGPATGTAGGTDPNTGGPGGYAGRGGHTGPGLFAELAFGA